MGGERIRGEWVGMSRGNGEGRGWGPAASAVGLEEDGERAGGATCAFGKKRRKVCGWRYRFCAKSRNGISGLLFYASFALLLTGFTPIYDGFTIMTGVINSFFVRLPGHKCAVLPFFSQFRAICWRVHSIL